MITVTLPKEQWEAVVKAIDLGLKGFKPAEVVIDKYRIKRVEETENNRHIKELNDEEILEYYKQTYNTYAQYEGFVDGVRWYESILKKASEK